MNEITYTYNSIHNVKIFYPFLSVNELIGCICKDFFEKKSLQIHPINSFPCHQSFLLIAKKYPIEGFGARYSEIILFLPKKYQKMAVTNGNGDHPKSYSRFKMKDLAKLNIEVKREDIFGLAPQKEPSTWLIETLENEPDILLDSEQGKSGFIISPVVKEMVKQNRRKMTVFPGYSFDIDPDKGLMGNCDFIFSKSERSAMIEAPVFFIVEAKNENLATGAAQCIAEMVAAQIFNAQEKKIDRPIYGVVTFGQQWQFYKLVGKVALQDTIVYNLSDLPKILGILQLIVDKD